VRLLRLVALRHMRERPLRAVLAAVAVAAGCAMAVAVLVVRVSATESVTSYARSLSGPTELRIVGPVRRGGLEPHVVDVAARTRGVAAAVPMVQGLALVEHRADGGAGSPAWVLGDETITVLGVDCRVEALVGSLGCTPQGLAALGNRPLAVGPAIDRADRLSVPGESIPLDGARVVDRLADLAGGRAVVFGLDTAQRLFDRADGVDVVYVDPEPVADVEAVRLRLEGVIGEQNTVLDAREGPVEVVSGLENALPLFTLIGVFAVGVGAMVVHNTAALSLAERRRDLAVVAALGGTSRTIAAATLGEAALVGVAGGVLGIVGGVGVAGPIVGSLSRFSERLAGVPLTVHVSWPAVVVSITLGLLMSVVAAALPVRRALRADVAAELSGRELVAEATPPVLARRAALFAVGTVVSVVAIVAGTRDGGIDRWQPAVGALGFAGVTLTLTMAGASLAPLALRPLGRLVGRSAPGRLAVANLTREPRRTGTMVVAVGVATATAFVAAGYINGVRTAIARTVADNIDGVQVRIVDESSNINLETGMSPEMLAVLDAVPGARQRSEGGANVLVGSRAGEQLLVQAFEDPWLDRTAVRGTIDRAAFADGGALINTALARRSGLRPGDVLRLPAPAGMVAVPVVAVVHGGGTSDTSALIPYDLFTRHYRLPPQHSVFVEPAPGTSIPELVRAVDEALTAAAAEGRISDPAWRVLTPDEVVAESVDSVSAQIAPFWTLQRGLLAVSFVAVLTTLLLVGIQRQRELGMLGAVGMEPAMLARMVLAEAGVVAVLAIGLTATGGFVMLWALNRVAPLLIGFTNPLAPDWPALAVWGTVSIVVALLAALWPARRAARTEVAAALTAD
jgi:putative ABC transport system permease protein